MKLPSSYQKKHITRYPRRQPALDIVSVRPLAPTKHVARASRILPQPALVPRKRILDGAYKNKRTFFSEMHKRSLWDVFWRMVRKIELFQRYCKRMVRRITPNIAPHKMLYGSLIGGIAFGMVSMAFMEHFFGPGVFARSSENITTAIPTPQNLSDEASDNTPTESYDRQSDIFFEYFNEMADERYKESVKEMVQGYPIEEMLPYIFEQDRLTAAFLVGIAKKESNWGKRIPVLDGQDCFNYWGYRGVRRMMGSGGHTCFNSRKDAVETVAKRLNTLIHSSKLDTPEKMIVWKCGFSCDGHSRESVKKWISDVDMYFREINEE
ncbi:MAG: hypothetical protein ACSLEX_00435 [Minisyncoccota bacterium]